MLQKETLKFLKNLKTHNDRTWFEEHRKQYIEAKADFEQFVTEVIAKFSKYNEEISWLTAKNCVFRINRDVRFSKDKSPYKTNMGAGLNKGGKKAPFVDYYFHCEPNNQSMVGGGLWLPEAENLKKVRQEIDYCWAEFKEIIQNEDFVAQFGDLEKQKYSLSRPPKGYEKDNPAIEYLKLKSIICSKSLTDEDLTSKDLLDTVVDAFNALQPLAKFIDRALES